MRQLYTQLNFNIPIKFPWDTKTEEYNQKKQQNWEQGQREASQAFNSAEAQKNRDWQTEMDNTQVQRRMSDLQSAGVNPVLAGQLTSGTPGGGVAAISGSNPSQEIEPAGKGSANIDKIAIQKTIDDMKTNSALREKTAAETKNTDANSALTEERTQSERIARAQISKQIAELDEKIAILKKDNKYYEANRLFRAKMELINTFTPGKSVIPGLRDVASIVNVSKMLKDYNF